MTNDMYPYEPPSLPKRRAHRGAWLVVGLVVVVLVGAVVTFLLTGGFGENDEGPSGGNTTVPGRHEISGAVDEEDAAVVLGVRLAAGQAFRVRVEPTDELDTELILVVDPDMADAIADVLAPSLIAAELIEDRGEILDDMFARVPEVLTSSQVQLDLAGGYTFFLGDQGTEGQPDADFFVAFVDGTYMVVAQSYSGSGSARLVLEVWDGTVDLGGDLAELMMDPDGYFEDTPWFSEPRFFDDEGSYEPG